MILRKESKFGKITTEHPKMGPCLRKCINKQGLSTDQAFLHGVRPVRREQTGV